MLADFCPLFNVIMNSQLFDELTASYKSDRQREKKREQDREELWRKLDELRLQEKIQNNRHDIQFTYNNNNNNLKDESPARAITESTEKLTCAE